MIRSLLKIFGWIPIPAIFLRPILQLLPKKYRENLTRNFLDVVEEEDLMSEFVQIILDKMEEAKYDVNRGKKFENTEEEVDEALKKFPALSPYKVYFMRWCERKRREVGLST